MNPATRTRGGLVPLPSIPQLTAIWKSSVRAGRQARLIGEAVGSSKLTILRWVNQWQRWFNRRIASDGKAAVCGLLRLHFAGLQRRIALIKLAALDLTLLAVLTKPLLVSSLFVRSSS